MPGMPSLPIRVPREHVQEDGARDKDAIYQTHRGKKPTSRDVGGLPTTGTVRDGLGIYEDED